MGNHTGAVRRWAGARLHVPRLQTFSSLKYRNYRFLWGSTFFSAAGDWVQQVTLGWLIFELTHSAFLVGALWGARSAPLLFLGPLAGVLSDRMDRRKLLLVNQAYLAAAALGLAIIVHSGHVQVWHLFLFTALNGAGFALNNPLRQALVVNTVPRDQLPNAIALTSTAFNINRMLGPAIGGLLIAVFGPATNFFIQAVAYVGVASMVFFIQVEQQRPTGPQRASPLSDLREGFNYVVNNQRILALILMAFVPSIFLMPFTTGLMPVFSKDVLHGGPEDLGMLLGVLGAGGMMGTLIVATLGTIGVNGRSGAIQITAGVISGLALIALSRATSVPLAVPLLVLLGVSQMIFIAINNTVIQTIVPDALRGRVMSFYVLNIGLIPLGSFGAGALARFYGAPVAMFIGGVLAASLVAFMAMRFAVVRRMAQG